jgi:acyl carrier protein
VHVTYKEIGKQEIEKGNSNIGKPIPSLSCFVLDEHQALLPIGIPGELYVGGAGLARGYLNRPELTGLRFIQSPFNPKERLYRSGDLVRYLPDGEMEYLGRIDDQVKIRGYRIELGEVENALLQHPLVLNAVVLAKTESQGETELIAYLVSDQTLDAADLKDHLSSLLPQYMLPSFYIQLDKIPLNANGKKDRKALLAKDTVLNLNKVVYSPPQDELEERIALCWSLALGREKELIGVEFNFFDIGGNSIRIVKLARAIRQELNKEISLAALFEYTTIRSFADYIRNDQTDHPVQEVEEVNQEELVADFEIFNIEEE